MISGHALRHTDFTRCASALLLGFILTGCGGGGANDSALPAAPTVSLTASPQTVANGSAAILTWSSTDATDCMASGAWSGAEATSGTASTGALAATSTFTLTCSGAGGSAQASRTVNVTVVPPAPTVSLSANPTTVATGASSMLTWSSTNATGCTASGAWSGAKAISGTASTGALAATSTFTLTCSGAGGSAQASRTVNVTVVPPAPTVSLSANPTTVAAGGTSTLTWSSTNATGCTASGVWSGAKATNGTASSGTLAATSIYTLTCSGAGGSGQASTTITVTGSPPAPTVTLTAIPTTVASGATTALTWSSLNATACTASGAWSGSRATAGSASSAALTATTNTFTLTCTGPGGSANTSAVVTVTPLQNGSYSTNFDATENPISEGGKWHRAVNAFTNVKTSGGIAYGSNVNPVVSGSFVYDDSYAVLSGFGADQTITVTVHRSASLNQADNHEIELLLRWSDNTSGASGYECLFNQAGGMELVQHNGPTNSISTLRSSSSGSTIDDGFVLKAVVSGNNIKMYINDVVQIDYTGALAYATGQPGLAFFMRKAGGAANVNWDYFAATSYSATSN